MSDSVRSYVGSIRAALDVLSGPGSNMEQLAEVSQILATALIDGDSLEVQLEAAELEWRSIPCYRRYLFEETNGAIGSIGNCGYCHVCIRRGAIRQTLAAADKGKR